MASGETVIIIVLGIIAIIAKLRLPTNVTRQNVVKIAIK